MMQRPLRIIDRSAYLVSKLFTKQLTRALSRIDAVFMCRSLFRDKNERRTAEL